MSEHARSIIEPFYARLLEIEKSDGVEASEKALMEMLKERAFNDVMNEIQNG